MVQCNTLVWCNRTRCGEVHHVAADRYDSRLVYMWHRLRGVGYDDAGVWWGLEWFVWRPGGSPSAARDCMYDPGYYF